MCASGNVQLMGGMRKDFCPNFLQPFLENTDRRSCNNRHGEPIPVFPQPSLKEPTLSLSGGSHIGVPCRDALLDRVGWEGEKTNSDQHPKDREYLEGGNQVSKKSSPLH